MCYKFIAHQEFGFFGFCDFEKIALNSIREAKESTCSPLPFGI
tara:strand:+ start:446 stop:574 length:129 start_codon:yes stop_codon:yes gene_type:complete